jgi:hypothetical protein
LRGNRFEVFHGEVVEELCREIKKSASLTPLMQRMRSNRMKSAARLSWKQRIVALLLFVVSMFMVIDPLWECHDHLDNLRHLGPHGVLMILLVVACASVSLLKSFQWLGLILAAIIAGKLRPLTILRRAFQAAPCPAFAATPLPLRI